MSDVALGSRSRIDRIGIALSAACVVHCLASPVLAVAAAAGGVELAEEGVHTGFAIVVVGVGMLAFVPGYRRHRRTRVLGGAALGMALVWTPALAGEALGPLGEPLVVVTGGLLLVQAHRWNRSFCAGCAICRQAEWGPKTLVAATEPGEYSE